MAGEELRTTPIEVAIQEASANLEPKTINDAIDLMEAEGLGRPFHIQKPHSQENDSLYRAGMGPSAKDTSIIDAPSDRAGYALISKMDRTGVVFFIKNGDILVLEPSDSDERTVTGFQRIFSPSTTPFFIGRDSTIGSPDILSFALLGESPLFGSKLVLKNDKEENAESIQTEIKKAVAVSRELKRQRETTKAQTGEFLLDVLGGQVELDVPFEEPQPPAPPAEPTPDVSKKDPLKRTVAQTREIARNEVRRLADRFRALRSARERKPPR